MKLKSLIILILLLSLNSFGQSNSRFSKEEVLKDLKTLRESLEDAHYNLYAYISEKEFDSVYHEVKGSIDKDSLNLLETTGIFQRLVSTVNNGHTGIDFPGQSYMKYAEAAGTLFPLEIAFEYDRPLIRKNFSDNSNIKTGSEILSINGVSMKEILSRIYPQISAERPYFKNVKIELYSFPRYYWQVFGKQDDFEVEIRSNGSVKTYSLKAVDLIEGYEMKRTEVLNAKMDLKFLGQAAYLNPGNFSGDEEKYQQFIDSAFVEIKERDSKNLIIDLRNNGGGDNSFSDYLVSYFADKPFKWNSSFTLKTSKFLKEHVRKHKDTTDAYWQEVLDHENGEIYSYEFEEYQPQPKEKKFTGKVFVLVNRQSHSQSAVTAAQIQDYKFGIIVGEETGDYPSLYASIFQYSLPNTGIPVNVSKGQIVRVNGSTKEEGVIPDIFIKDHLLDDEDEILEGLLNKID
ncbi:S41 family peptidase [Christiangramia crocea]|uniref:S41 family peptidase n=1 Tax=Christiangramia crocea TaxID=2904124 RepID=A0A9X1UVR2_9FLAO|nr:S41 family peptidase [Gramella crocea]MCG9970960.1 S41 family peptidase [Gramella crocea]